MKVLVACECSGVVRDAFLALGHDALSCDIEPSETPGPHHQGDVRDLLENNQYDLMIAHPPCTYLARVSAPVLARDPTRSGKMIAALNFFLFLWQQPIALICVENPYPLKLAGLWPPAQVVQPYYFGEPWTKATCLWLKGLPPLHATAPLRNIRQLPENEKSWAHQNRAGTIRARTFPGIAQAMATQWGGLRHPYGFFT